MTLVENSRQLLKKTAQVRLNLSQNQNLGLNLNPKTNRYQTLNHLLGRLTNKGSQLRRCLSLQSQETQKL